MYSRRLECTFSRHEISLMLDEFLMSLWHIIEGHLAIWKREMLKQLPDAELFVQKYFNVDILTIETGTPA